MASKKRIKRSNLLLKNAADFFMPFALVLGLSVVLHGHLTPGGGFQGGVLVASVAILLFLGYGWEVTNKSLKMEMLKKNEAFAAVLYVGLALAGLFTGTYFCRNIFFANGEIGHLLSAGTVAFMNVTVGYKVMTGVSFLLLLMLSLLAQPDEEEEEEEEEGCADDHC
ncbi:MAG: MnhB domain-containing protein [Bacillota bacterium]|nr:MnhB domain-containing protein [Bacillota bacterium]